MMSNKQGNPGLRCLRLEHGAAVTRETHKDFRLGVHPRRSKKKSPPRRAFFTDMRFGYTA